VTRAIRREMLIPQPREQVWRALTDSAALAEWMFPNDFEARVGHRFTFRVPPNPRMVDGLVVRCEVLECEPPRSLAFSWSAGGPVENTRVSFRLEPDGDGTRLVFEHSGFDLSLPFGEQALKGAEFGWAKMFRQLAAVVTGLAALGGQGDRQMLSELRDLSERWFQAWLEKDDATVERLMAEDYLYVGPSGSVLDRQAILRIIRSPSYRLDHGTRTEVVVRGLTETGGHEAAVVRHRYQGAGSFEGTSFTDDHRCVMIWERTASGWRLVMEQCSFNGK
jgi:uncharacterized protein YndB with AHSA1/START domain